MDRIHAPWASIPRDYRTTTDGVRKVMHAGPHGTTLSIWHGPKCTACPAVAATSEGSRSL